MIRFYAARPAFGERIDVNLYDSHTGRAIQTPSFEHAYEAAGILNSRVVVHEVFVPASIAEEVEWTGQGLSEAEYALLSAQTSFSNYLDRTFGEHCIAPWDWPADMHSFSQQLEWEEEARRPDYARESFGEYRGI